MDTYLYFAGIDGGGGAADGTGQAYLGKAKNLRGVLPISVTTTGIYFTSGKESIGDDAAVDLITVTHADTTQSTASNRVRLYLNGTQITSFNNESLILNL